MCNNLVKRLAPNQIRKIIELSKAGTSIAKIAESLEINKTSVYYHARKYCHKMTKLDINLLNDSEKGYIIGVFLGDGSFNKGKKNTALYC
jgi:intein-encoded DNA endonuclease-like protein